MDAAIVPNFIVVDTDYQMLPAQLTGGVRHFAGSMEYSAIDDRERDRPDIVFSALVQLCIRLHKQEVDSSLSWRERATLSPRATVEELPSAKLSSMSFGSPANGVG